MMGSASFTSLPEGPASHTVTQVVPRDGLYGLGLSCCMFESVHQQLVMKSHIFGNAVFIVALWPEKQPQLAHGIPVLQH